MEFQGEAFNFILKEYLKGKKDNINFILLSLRDLIIEKCKKHKLKQNEIKVVLKFLVHGINNYSFEKSISFYDYIDLYLDVSINEYRNVDSLDDFDIELGEFMGLFIDNLKEIIADNPIIKQ